jgi:hypothetical protein
MNTLKQKIKKRISDQGLTKTNLGSSFTQPKVNRVNPVNLTLDSKNTLPLAKKGQQKGKSKTEARKLAYGNQRLSQEELAYLTKNPFLQQSLIVDSRFSVNPLSSQAEIQYQSLKQRQSLSALKQSPQLSVESSKTGVLTQTSAQPKFGLLKTNNGRDFVHPHNYASILGYRKKALVVNPSVSLHGIRRVLHYLKTVTHLSSTQVNTGVSSLSAELIVVIDGSQRTSHSKPSLKQPKAELNSKPEVMLKGKTTRLSKSKKGVLSAASLLDYSLSAFSAGGLYKLPGLIIVFKTHKETLSYLAQKPASFNRRVTTAFENPQTKVKLNGAINHSTLPVCGVLMLNPAKSILSSFADSLSGNLNKKRKGTAMTSAGNAIGRLCSKKGIPLISLCDVASPINFCTYPIFCDTRNVKSIYYVLDLLVYGLNQLKAETSSRSS